MTTTTFSALEAGMEDSLHPDLSEVPHHKVAQLKLMKVCLNSRQPAMPACLSEEKKEDLRDTCANLTPEERVVHDSLIYRQCWLVPVSNELCPIRDMQAFFSSV